MHLENAFEAGMLQHNYKMLYLNMIIKCHEVLDRVHAFIEPSGK